MLRIHAGTRICLLLALGLLLAVALAACGDTPSSTGGGMSFEFPGASGVKAITLDQDLINATIKQTGVPGTNLRVYVSDEAPQNFATALDKYLTGQGYNYAQGDKVQQVNENYLGVYSNKNGTNDIVFNAFPVIADPATLFKGSTVSDSAIQKFVDQVKGKKSLVTIFYGPGLVKRVVGDATTAAPISVTVQNNLGSPTTPNPTK